MKPERQLLTIPEFKGRINVLDSWCSGSEVVKLRMNKKGRPKIGVDLSAVKCVNGAAAIPLRHSTKVTLIDEADLPFLAAFTWREHHQGYAQAAHNGKQVRLHTLLMRPPEGMMVDHINRNRLDNRRCNLRVVTREENMRNTGPRKDCRSGVKGVYPTHSGSWAANIRLDGKLRYLGSFKEKRLAAEARLIAEIIRGDHAI